MFLVFAPKSDIMVGRSRWLFLAKIALATFVQRQISSKVFSVSRIRIEVARVCISGTNVDKAQGVQKFRHRGRHMHKLLLTETVVNVGEPVIGRSKRERKCPRAIITPSIFLASPPLSLYTSLRAAILLSGFGVTSDMLCLPQPAT